MTAGECFHPPSLYSDELLIATVVATANMNLAAILTDIWCIEVPVPFLLPVHAVADALCGLPVTMSQFPGAARAIHSLVPVQFRLRFDRGDELRAAGEFACDDDATLLATCHHEDFIAAVGVD